MNPKYQTKVLFFIADFVPTEDEKAAAAQIKANVVFRNARFVSIEDGLEPCDGVAGKVPEQYAKAYPAAHVAVDSKSAAYKALKVKVGDSEPPVGKKPANSELPVWGAPAPSGE